MPDLNQELAILLEEEPEGITRLLLALSQGTIRGAGHDPPYLDEHGVSYYYTRGPYGVMFDDAIEAMHKTFKMRKRISQEEGRCPITPLELFTGFFVEGEITLTHLSLFYQIQQIQKEHDQCLTKNNSTRNSRSSRKRTQRDFSVLLRA